MTLRVRGSAVSTNCASSNHPHLRRRRQQQQQRKSVRSSQQRSPSAVACCCVALPALVDAAAALHLWRVCVTCCRDVVQFLV